VSNTFSPEDGNKSRFRNVVLFLVFYSGRVIAQAVSRQLPRFDPSTGHVGFVVDKVALGQVFSEY
jgi:hypothetical protein